ncbi:MAG: acetolactate decarboxylase [Atopobiaceae bacterium]|jgi:alpha-acetolactate decarboxylase|nr:acetolactate decarboxylase [Atopobiaceae bacterium]MCI2173126.1 acetolactate decarboxylase [Atopobiaceae bacterium]MCI2208219.1 acetolactate decarboxylase [Atopobiaceae bacterium]
MGLATRASDGSEVAILNGVAYAVDEGGIAAPCAVSTGLSWCQVAPFDHYAPVFLAGALADIDDLVAHLDSRREVVAAESSCHVLVATGSFVTVALAPVCQPFGHGAAMDGGDQCPQLSFEDVEATIIGVRLPREAGGKDHGQWHMHLVSRGRKICGHLVGFVGGDLACQVRRYDDLTTHIGYPDVSREDGEPEKVESTLVSL